MTFWWIKILACATKSDLCYKNWPVLRNLVCTTESDVCYKKWNVIQKAVCGTKRTHATKVAYANKSGLH